MSFCSRTAICKLLSKFLGGKSFYSWKLIISRSKPLQIDEIFNGEIFLNFEFGYSKWQVIVSQSLKKISG